jgi:hypothetical protein
LVFATDPTDTVCGCRRGAAANTDNGIFTNLSKMTLLDNHP